MAQSLADSVKHFVTNQVLPLMDNGSKENFDTLKCINGMKSLRLFGLNVPKEFGGHYADRITIIQVFEALSSSPFILCKLLIDHMRACEYLIKFATEKQKCHYLPSLANGDMIAALPIIIEDHETNGEGFTSFITRDLPSTDHWLLSGRTEWISNVKHANLYLIPVRLIPALNQVQSAILLLSKQNMDDFGIENNLPKVEDNLHKTGTILYKKCSVKTSQVIGEFIHDGHTVVDSAENFVFIASSVCFLGIYQSIIDRLRNYPTQFKQKGVCEDSLNKPMKRLEFGDLVIKFEAVKSFFVDCCSKWATESGDINSSSLISCQVYFMEISQLLAARWMATSGHESDQIDECETDEDKRTRDILSTTMTNMFTNSIINEPLENQSRKHKRFDSMILKYSFRISPAIDLKYLLRLSVGEQEQIIDAGYYGHAHLYLYDMTTMNPTQTFKDYIGCLTLAYCLQNNINCFCLQSSGNTAVSIIHYGRQTPHIKIIVFYMEKNAYKIDSHNLPKNVILVQVNGTEKVMRQIVKRFSDLTNIPILPNDVIQINANKLRANYLNDNYIKKGVHFDWLVQSLSGAYGPIGLYHGFTEIESKMKVPKLFGVQQEAVCPYVKTLGKHRRQNTMTTGEDIFILEPTLFRTEPGPELTAKMKNILDTYGGELKMLTNQEYYDYSVQATNLLADNGIHIELSRNNGNQVQETAGLLAVAAVLHEIDRNDSIIMKDQTVVICVTGGTRAAPEHLPVPKITIDDTIDDEQLQNILY